MNAGTLSHVVTSTATATSEEMKTGGSRSHHLRSRQSVKPTDPGYDAHVVAHIKSRTVVDTNGCWLWQGFKHWNGYGSIGYRARNWPFHRAMWACLKGAIPEGLQVCHTCDVRNCCNPDHLWLGTNRENITDMTRKGRGPCGKKSKQTHCLRGHPFSGDNLIIYHDGKHRACKECQRLYSQTEKGRQSSRDRSKRRRQKLRAARMAQKEQRA